MKKVILGFLTVFCLIHQLEASHGISLYNAPLKYTADFKNFDYVNPEAPKGGELKLSAINTFDSFNPFVVKGTPAAGLTPLYPSLLHATLSCRAHDEPFSDYGYVAESYEVDPQGLWITYTLRDNITFHDGSPITADDVIYTFKQLLEKGSPLYKAYYHSVKDVIKLDQKRVKFTFVDNTSKEQIMILGELPVLSKAYFEKKGFDNTSLEPPLGSGPYRIDGFESGQYVTYKRVQNWWGQNIPVNKGRYNFETIRFKYFKDLTVSFEAFKGHEYDFRHENSAKNWVRGYDFKAFLEGKVKKLEYKDKVPAAAQVLAFNTRRSIFSDLNVRKALTYAFDFEWLNKNLFYNIYERLPSYFSASDLESKGLISDAEKTILTPYKDELPSDIFEKPFELPTFKRQGDLRTNLIKAESLLRKAGWIVKDGVCINEKTGERFEFEILLADPSMEKAVQGFAQNLKKLGIKARLRVVDTPQYVQRTQNYDYDMIMVVLPQSISPGNEQRDFWSSASADQPGGRNYSGIKNKVIDELVELVIDAETRGELVDRVNALDRVLLWNYYTLPLWFSSYDRYAYWNNIMMPAILPSYIFDMYALYASSGVSPDKVS